MDDRPRSAGRLAILAVIVMLLSAGCSVLPGSVTGRACDGISDAKCVELIEQAQRDAPPAFGGISGVWIRCTAVCTDDAGEVEMVISYANGQNNMTRLGWQTAGPAPGMPGGPPVGPVDPTPLPVRPACIGVPGGWCEEQAAAAMTAALDSGPIGTEGLSIVVRCTATCTDDIGEGVTVVSWAGIAGTEVGWSYSGALPPSP